MKTTQAVWKASEGWKPEKPMLYQGVSQLLLVFGAPAALTNSALLQGLSELHPDAHVFGCSTAGEIC